MKVELLSITPNIEKHIELCGRTCYQSYDKITDYSAGRFIKMLIKSGHESVVEHGVATFKISDISRACSHQLVRHRLASYSQKSQRYVEDRQFSYIVPESISNNEKAYPIYLKLMTDIELAYAELMKITGIKKEDARFVLPNACTTEIVMTANMRQWRHFLNERLSSAAQWEIRELANKVLDIFKKECPNIVDDFF